MTSVTTPFIPPPSVLAQIAGLPTLTIAELKTLWRTLFGSDAPVYNRQFLERRLAYRLQERAFRQVDTSLLERQQRRIAALMDTSSQKKRTSERAPAPGTVLVRDYQGVEYRVVATVEGDYEFNGRRYASLSKIARDITGTRWSGPRFFGIPSAVPAKVTRKGAAR